MLALLAIPFKKFGGWIMAALAIVGSVFVIAEESKSKGKLEQQTADSDAIATREINENTAATQTEVKAVENANDVKTDVAALPSGDAAKQLLADWQQPSTAISSGGSPGASGGH